MLHPPILIKSVLQPNFQIRSMIDNEKKYKIRKIDYGIPMGFLTMNPNPRFKKFLLSWNFPLKLKTFSN